MGLGQLVWVHRVVDRRARHVDAPCAGGWEMTTVWTKGEGVSSWLMDASKIGACAARASNTEYVHTPVTTDTDHRL